MSTQPPFDSWEARVQAAARQMVYPATPDLGQAADRHRAIQSRQRARHAPRGWAWALALLLVMGTGLLAVPDIRASLGSFVRIGTLTIVQSPPAAPPASPAPPAVLRDLAGSTTLDQARMEVPFAIKQPTYPPDLGPPDQVYVQALGEHAVILVWLDPNQPERVALSLYTLSSDIVGRKLAQDQTVLQETSVNNTPAVWIRGPHPLELRNGDIELRQLVDANVLVWTQDDLTYRLETDRSLDEAVRIAESLR